MVKGYKTGRGGFLPSSLLLSLPVIKLNIVNFLHIIVGDRRDVWFMGY